MLALFRVGRRRFHREIGKGHHADFDARMFGNGPGYEFKQFNPLFGVQK